MTALSFQHRLAASRTPADMPGPTTGGRRPPPGRHALADPRRHRVRGVAGQENASGAPPVGDAHVVAVDHGPQNFDVFGGDALVAQDLPNRLLAQQVLLILLRAGRILPAVVAE